MAYGGLNKQMDASAEVGRNPVSKSTIFSLSMKNMLSDAGRDGLTCLARPTSRARTRTGEYLFPTLS